MINMETIVIDNNSNEDIALAFLIDEGRKSGYIEEITIIDTLEAIKQNS